MRIAFSCLALALAAVAVPALAADAPAATAVVCTSIQNNSCEGANSTFPSNVGKLWGFSQVSDVSDKIVHVWFYRDKELGRIDLPVKAARWRTWSNVTVAKNMAGPWRLEVRESSGKVLAAFNFTIE